MTDGLDISQWGKMISENHSYFHATVFLKFIHSEKATKFCEIFTILLSYVVPVKSKMKISQNFVAFSEYMNFNDNVIQKLFYPTQKKFFSITRTIFTQSRSEQYR